jgi:hypothetical protein
LLAAQLYGGSLQAESGVLGGGDFQIGNQTIMIPIIGNLQLPVGGSQSVGLFFVLAGEEVLRSQVNTLSGPDIAQAMATVEQNFWLPT